MGEPGGRIWIASSKIGIYPEMVFFATLKLKEELVMKSFNVIGVIATILFALSIFLSPVQADISLSGDLEIDTSYTTTTDEDADNNDVADADSTDETIYDLGGRIKVVPAVRTEAGNLFMEAKAQVLAKTDGTTAIDDAWGKIGTSVFDIQIGRFEGWSLFDKSNDMVIAEAQNADLDRQAVRYETNYARGRMDNAGQLALHVLPSDAFGLELGLIYGNDGDDNVIGFRPVVNSKLGPMEIAVGADMLNTTPKNDATENADSSKIGFGAKVKATFGIVTLGINYANGTEENDATPDSDQTTNSVGGYCDLALGKGVLTLAAFLTNWEEDNYAYEKTHNQYFISYAHPLPVDGAAIKVGLSQATATEETAGADIENDALAFKVRLYYSF
jgi:hypothetical protein